MKKFIKEIAASSKWRIAAFGGQLLIEGRILSPAQAQAAGLASGLIASEIAFDRTGEEFKALQERIEGQKEEEINPSDLVMLTQILKKIRPEQMINLSDHQDRVICQCVQRASMDEGATWDKLTLCMAEGQQNPDQGRLWVGMLTTEDRNEILDKCLKGHKEAALKLSRFRE
jgi:hypothetical protein